MINSYILGINSDTNADLGYDTYFIDATSNNITLTLPDMSTMASGKRYVLHRIDTAISNTVEIIPTATTIDGSSSVFMNSETSIVLLYYNGIWEKTNVLGIHTPTWIRISKSHTDFQAASLSNDIEIWTLQEGAILQGVFIKHSTQFSGTGIASYTISIGISGNLAKYSPAFSVSSAVSDTNFQPTQNFYVENWGSTTSIRANAITTGANLDQSTSGEVDIFLLISKIKQ